MLHYLFSMLCYHMFRQNCIVEVKRIHFRQALHHYNTGNLEQKNNQLSDHIAVHIILSVHQKGA